MNTIVILCDSFRADHLGCYADFISQDKNMGLGPELPVSTPNLDKLAGESALFYHAYPEGVPTLPVRSSLFTGRVLFPFRGWQRLERSDTLISEVLGAAGLNTALIADTYHMRYYGYKRGFKYNKYIRGQEYDIASCILRTPFIDTSSCYRYRQDCSLREKIMRYFMSKQTINNMRKRITNGIFNTIEDTYVARTFNAAKQYLENQDDKDNLFLWVDSFDPHEPWNPPEPFAHKYNPNYESMDLICPHPGEVGDYINEKELYNIRSLYAGEVELVDKIVGDFITYLRERDWLDKSLLIFISDHGEPLGESHGKRHQGILRKARPWCYEELMRIPLLIRHPDGHGSGKEFKNFVITSDIMPTILDFLHVKKPKTIDGLSLIPLLKEEQDHTRNKVILGWHGFSTNLRTYEYSYHNWTEDPPELYNRKGDLYERKDKIEENKDLANKFQQEIEEYVKNIIAKHPEDKVKQIDQFYLFDKKL
ncbi:MAG: sulfatase-like hydrolase/transferase [Candidatus Lokiarchaeota archaeon]|nr:sulfatase-like hydrolase/transferase [Candidatus Lokiarchaeota archaeon]